MSSLTWYVAYTQSQSEARAAQGVARHGFESYLPILRRQVRHRGKRIMIARPLFARYLFIGFEAQPPWLEVCGIAGIVTIVGNKGKPLRIDAAIVDRLRERIEADDFEDHKAPMIRRGMAVRIGAGPMKGTEGVCASVMDDVRAELLVKLLGQTVRVRINIDQLVERPPEWGCRLQAFRRVCKEPLLVALPPGGYLNLSHYPFATVFRKPEGIP